MKWTIWIALVWTAAALAQTEPAPAVAGNTLPLPPTVFGRCEGRPNWHSSTEIRLPLPKERPLLRTAMFTSRTRTTIEFTNGDVIQKALSIFLEPSGRANGQYFDGKGNLLTASDERDQLWAGDSRRQTHGYRIPCSNRNISMVLMTSGCVPTAAFTLPIPTIGAPGGPMIRIIPQVQPQAERAVYFISPNHETVKPCRRRIHDAKRHYRNSRWKDTVCVRYRCAAYVLFEVQSDGGARQSKTGCQLWF